MSKMLPVIVSVMLMAVGAQANEKSTRKPASAEVVASCNEFQIVAENGYSKIVWPTDEKTPVRLAQFGNGKGPTNSFYVKAADRVIFVNFTTSARSSLVETFSVIAGQTASTAIETCSQ